MTGPVVGPKTRLELRQYTDAQSSVGSRSTTWTGKRSIKGVLTQLSGNERMSMDKETVFATHRFYCKPPVGLNITEKDEFLNFQPRGPRAQTFKVQLVKNPDGQQRMLAIDLLEQV